MESMVTFSNQSVHDIDIHFILVSGQLVIRISKEMINSHGSR